MKLCTHQLGSIFLFVGILFEAFCCEGTHGLQLRATGSSVNSNQQLVLQQLGVNTELETTVSNSTETKLLTKIDQLPEWAQILIGTLGIIIGLAMTLQGFKFFKVSLFFVTGFTGALIVGYVIDQILADDLDNRIAILWGVSVGFGAIFGSLCVYFFRIGVFVAAASVGVILAMVLNPFALRYIWPEEPMINMFIWMGVFALVFGLAALCFEKKLMMISTACAGAFMVILSIGIFAGNFPTIIGLGQREQDDIPTEWWLYLGGWAFLFIFGVIFQAVYSSRHKDYEKYDKLGGGEKK